jgi:MFS superfamily sulfate permease-like transporter
LFGLVEQGSGQQHILHRLWLTVSRGGPINFRAVAIGFGTAALVLVLRSLARRFRLPRVDMLLALAVAAAVTMAFAWSHPGATVRPPCGRSAACRRVCRCRTCRK